MGRPRLLRPAPSPARLTATRRLPDRPIFPPSRADGRAPLKGSFSPPAPQKRQQDPAKRRRRGGSTPPVCPTPRLCALGLFDPANRSPGADSARGAFPTTKENTDPYAAGEGPAGRIPTDATGEPFPLNSYMRTAPERCRTAHGRGVRGYDRGGRPIAVCATFTNRGFV